MKHFVLVHHCDFSELIALCISASLAVLVMVGLFFTRGVLGCWLVGWSLFNVVKAIMPGCACAPTIRRGQALHPQIDISDQYGYKL